VLDEVVEVTFVEATLVGSRMEGWEMLVWIFLDGFFKQLSCYSIAFLSVSVEDFLVTLMNGDVVVTFLGNYLIRFLANFRLLS